MAAPVRFPLRALYVSRREPMRTRTRFSAQIVELFARLLDLEDGEDDEDYRAAHSELRQLLALKPWQPSPFDVSEGEPPEHIARYEPHLKHWNDALQLRRRLFAALQQRDAGTCPQCNRHFTRTRSWARFCSPECRQTFHNANLRKVGQPLREPAST